MAESILSFIVLIILAVILHAGYIELTWDYDTPESRILLLKKIIREDDTIG